MTTKKKTKKTKKFKVTVKDEATTATPAVATTTQASADATTQAPAASAEGTLSAVALSTTTPIVGQTVTAVLTPANPTDVASYAWYANEDVIAGETTKTLKITTAYLTKKIKVVVTNKDGKTFESAASEAVTEDKSANVTISVEDALQADGSVLYRNGITFRVAYGKSFGDPVKVQWFSNEAVAGTYTTDNGDLQYTWTPVNKTFLGKIYCEVTNKDGVVKQSNELILTDKEAPATISNFTITDDTATPNVDFAAEDTKSVITVKMSKAYAGKFYLFKSDVAKFDEASATSSFDTATAVLFNGTLSEAAAINAGNAIYQVADDKTITYMFGVNAALPRGGSYVLVFDQTNLSSDNLGGATLNKSEVVKVPYVTTAQSIKITKLANGVNAQATVYSDAAATKKAEFINGTNYGTVSFYNHTASDDATKFNQLGNVVTTADKGVFESSMAATNAAKYMYATYNVAKGICSSDAISIQSNIVMMPGDPAVSIVCAKGKTDTDLKVTFTSLESAGTLYVYRDGLGDSAKSGDDEFDATKSSTYIKSVTVNPGQGEVFVDASVSCADIYGATFVPSDLNKYCAQAATPVPIAAEAKSYKLTSKSGQKIKGDGTTAFDLTAVDQWGGSFEIKKNDPNLKRILACCREAFDPFKSSVDDVANTGKLAIRPLGGKLHAVQLAAATEGEAYAVKLGVVDQYFTAVCTTAGAAGTAEWTVGVTDKEPRFDENGDVAGAAAVDAVFAAVVFSNFSKTNGTTKALKFESKALDQFGENIAVTAKHVDLGGADANNNLVLDMDADGGFTISVSDPTKAVNVGTYDFAVDDFAAGTTEDDYAITVTIGAAVAANGILKDSNISNVSITKN